MMELAKKTNFSGTSRHQRNCHDRAKNFVFYYYLYSELTRTCRKAYDLYVDGNAASGDDYTAALKVVIEKQAKREEKKNNPKAPSTPPAPKKRRTNSKKGGSDATTPYKAPQSGDAEMTGN